MCTDCVYQAAENLVATLAHCATPAVKIEAAKTNLAACRVIKTAEERQFTLGVAYPAMKPDVGRAADGHRDFVSSEVLEKTAWEWMSKHREINLFHQEGGGHGTVVESYIWRAGDWTQESPVDGKSYVVKAGDWLIGVQWSDTAWPLVKAGLVNGWSPEGTARRSKPSPERLALLRS
jgi:hypothetical protein